MEERENYTLTVTLSDMSESADIFAYLSNRSSVASISVKRASETKSDDSRDNNINFSTDSTLGRPGEATQSILRKLGIVPSLNGYSYLAEAINYELILNEPNISITKCVYPYIAKKYSSSTAKIERSIRHAIETCWKSSNIKIFEMFFGCKLEKKPTNAQFISAISEYIKENDPRFVTHLRSMDHLKENLKNKS